LRLLLDTSAIIGWLERTNSTLPAMLAESESVDYHPVTLGELQAGVERAATEDELEMRTNTIRFTQSRLQAVGHDVLPYEQFGFLTARFSQKLSHNDFWIVSSALASVGCTLVTEDAKLFAVVSSDEFAEAVASRSWVRPACHLVTSSPVRAI